MVSPDLHDLELAPGGITEKTFRIVRIIGIKIKPGVLSRVLKEEVIPFTGEVILLYRHVENAVQAGFEVNNPAFGLADDSAAQDGRKGTA